MEEDQLRYREMPEMIKQAKEYLEKRKYIKGERRKWLGPFRIPMYNYRIKEEGMEIWALEGSPMRGFVVANYGLGKVTVHDINHCILKSFYKHYERRT